MTFHTALVILDSAERSHKEEHHHALTLHCFLTALRDNAKAAGYTPLEFTKQWTRILPKLQSAGLVKIGTVDRCGRAHLNMTIGGRATLEHWNANGCESHQKGKGYNRPGTRCVAPILLERLNGEAA